MRQTKTRKASLSPAGRKALEQCRQIVADLIRANERCVVAKRLVRYV